MTKEKRYAIGIDIGGTYIKSGLVDQKGNIIDKEKRPIDKDNKHEFFEQFLVLQDYWKKNSKDAELIGIGVGIPGFINHKTGVLDQSPNLPVIDNSKIFREFNNLLSLPVVVDNDANAAAYGEFWAGGGHDAECLILLTLGTGIGGGIVWNGNVWHGFSGYAGEIGHTKINVSKGILCNCGQRGCLESEFGAAAMIRKAKMGLVEGRKSVLDSEEYPLKGKFIVKAAKDGDELAGEIINTGCRYLGMVIGNLINIFNPDQIVLGGGIIASSDYILPIIMEGVKESAIAGPFAGAKIKPSKLGNDAGLLGAAGLAWKKWEKK